MLRFANFRRTGCSPDLEPFEANGVWPNGSHADSTLAPGGAAFEHKALNSSPPRNGTSSLVDASRDVQYNVVFETEIDTAETLAR